MSPLPTGLGDGAVLRRLTLDDLEQVWALVEAERERIGVWMPWVEHTTSIEDQRQWIESVVTDEQSVEGCGIFVDGTYAGGVGLTADAFGIAGDIGYWIGSAHEGRGLVTRAVRVLIDIGFRELGLHRLVIRAGVENLRSRAVPERLGFTREGIARGEGRGSGGFYDLVVHSLLDDEWRTT
ncbi:MAG: GNAT family N-acetyltransferase [Actinomycetota bacterium]